ncbi:ABC transporter permease [Paenibacillus sp. FSL R7-0273]|uniref:cytochrome c biogenesis protein CcsA n=1 Tax=Paenibacillus sp. FSL R7-0273 TaxID=1536772 RepID=UPI0004F636B1|nr:cytochrome c biogenesis protein CcsA [Paenibacillus sp. FSL R7-0273]AIQ48983.1 ABC transporter permease [Paenibacillus sp. FSL R7-0273]OMF90537.1 ABC transporter permease [Paenibacillus sp. FSL R7-0273]
MQLLNGIYDAALLLYALSLLFIFSDCLKRNPGGKRLGTGLLAVTGLLQLAGLAVRFSQEGGLPIFTPYDFLFWFSFIIVLTSLALAFTRGGEFTILLISGAGFSVFLLNRVWLTAADHGLESWRAVHGWLAMHIILANLSFGALTLGTAFAIMYLFLHTKLKSKKWDDRIRRLPSLETMDKYSYTAILAGVPLLIVSLVLAAMSIIAEGRTPLFQDSKVLTTMVGLGVYIAYILLKRSGRRSGTVMARWAISGYAFIILNFLLNSLSDFHGWSGR